MQNLFLSKGFFNSRLVFKKLVYSSIFFLTLFPMLTESETITITPSSGDTYITQNAPAQNFGAQATATVQSLKNQNQRALYQFDLSLIPPWRQIDSATLLLTLTSGSSYSINIHRVTSSWLESAVTWNTSPGYSETVTSSGVNNWNVTADVQYFYSNPTQNYGWLLKFAIENNGKSLKNQYQTKEAATGKPQLQITYSPLPSDPPFLAWTGKPGFETNGLEPETGEPNDQIFSYKVKYTDADNDLPASGYPRVHILTGGSEISGSPFPLTPEDAGDNDYTDGRLYGYTTTLPSGDDFTYYFEAQDRGGLLATGEPTGVICAPVVTNTGLYIYVDPNGDDSTGDGTEGRPYLTIGKGLTVAVSGRTVLVNAGLYLENPVMKQGVGLSGIAGPLQTAIVGDGSSGVVTFPGQMTNCNLSGFDISGGNNDGGIFFDASGYGISHLTISNCKIHGQNGPGIKLHGAVAPIIKDNEIYQNSCAGISSLASTTYDQWKDTVGELTGPTDGRELFLNIRNNLIHHNSGAGIALRSADGGSYYRITIGGDLPQEGNQIYDNAKAGIALGSLGQVRIKNNYVSNNSTPSDKYAAGIYIQDISPNPDIPTFIQDNEICYHSKAAIKVEGASTLIIEDNDIYNNWSGIVLPTSGTSSQWSSRPILIKGNYIHNNTQGSEAKAGIALGSPDTPLASLEGKVTITQNEIAQNLLAGIGIFASCEAEITKNNIHESLTKGGIHTGGGSPTLTITHNKVHHNPNSSSGGGIDIRHIYSGQIENNLVYKNGRGGIRFGNGVTSIINNTVAYNGNQRRGGGIIYDDLYEDPNGFMTGSSDGFVIIRNNISVFNETAGLRMGEESMCPANIDAGDGFFYRDYNLLYGNNGEENDCGWVNGFPYIGSCLQKQYAKCAFIDKKFTNLYNPEDLIADPLFINAFLDNYHLQTGSPAISAGYDDRDLGAYGGIEPMFDANIPGW